MYKQFVPCLIVLSLTACQLSPSTSKNHLSTTVDTHHLEAQKLQNYIERAWQLRLEANPDLAYSNGDKQAAGKLVDMSSSALAEMHAKQLKLLNELKQLAHSKLNKEEKINAQILQYQLQNSVDQYRYKEHYLPISSESGFHAYIASIAKGRFNTLEDYQHYIDKLQALPTYFAEQTYWLKQGLNSEITAPQITLKGFEDSISAFIVPTEESGYFAPFTRYPDSFTEQEKQQLTQQGKALVANTVIPTYQAFFDFMTKKYIPQARTTIGASAFPNGNEYYENRVRHFTTLDITADEVHQLGLKEVKRIRKEMQTIIEKVGFKGDFAAFLEFLRTDPQFYPRTERELLEYASYIAKKPMLCYRNISASYQESLTA